MGEIWIGIAIGIILTSIFGMALLVVVSKQKTAPIPPELKEYWGESLRLQRLSVEALLAIAENGKKNIKVDAGLLFAGHCDVEGDTIRA